MLEDLKKTLSDMLAHEKKSGIHFDLPRLKEKIRSYDVEMSDPSFWDNPDKAREISQKLQKLKQHQEQPQPQR